MTVEEQLRYMLERLNRIEANAISIAADLRRLRIEAILEVKPPAEPPKPAPPWLRPMWWMDRDEG